MVSMDEDTNGLEGEDRTVRLHSRYRCALIVTAVVSLLVGGVIGSLGFDELAVRSPGLTPPAAWMTPVGEQIAVVLTIPPTVTPPLIHVYVSGSVAQPQVVVLPSGSLVADAIEAAGGALPTSDLDELNLAALVHDHDHVVVPGAVDRERVHEGGGASTGTNGLIDINSASAEDLDGLPSIGETRAAEIVAYREDHGPFTSTRALLDVPGIGPGIYADVEPWITVE
jgi:competence protein ComEA